MRVELREVHKRFGRTAALRGITTVIPEGRRLALIGPNGSGKSTLIRALLGLVCCEGEVRLDGRSPFEERLEVARRLAYVPQVAPQVSAPVGELVRAICLTRGLDEDPVRQVARRLELDLGEIGRRPFRDLSGGMKQKLLVSLAFAAGPELLVLDEPTASLDARARVRFFQLCGELPGATTIVLCSHRLEELEQLATHVLALDEGRVAWEGPAQAMAQGTDRRVVEVLLEEQAGEPGGADARA